jgi:hypothetical protein
MSRIPMSDRRKEHSDVLGNPGRKPRESAGSSLSDEKTADLQMKDHNERCGRDY